MKHIKTLIALAFLHLSICTTAQYNSPVEYLNKFNKPMEELNQKYINYTSAAAHSSARKSERKYRDYVEQIQKTKYALIDISYYNKDKSLHAAYTEYLTLIQNVMNENYNKVVNLEDIAEKSYDNMEAYILLQKSIEIKMEEASDKLKMKEKEFATKNNITLTESTDEKDNKMKTIGKVHDYKNEIYLIFFKCAYQNDELIAAMNKNNITSVEQVRGTMKKFAEEGLARLDTIKNFNGDASLKSSCKNALKFFIRQAERSVVFVDYSMKEQAYKQIKKAFESNSKAKSDQAEIDKYNKAVDEMNKASKAFNDTNDELNKERKGIYEDYNKTASTFLDTHMPYAK